jgi:threonine dehydratase
VREFPPGAFKVRGASNAVFGPDDEQAKLRRKPIHRATSCLSYAASRRGIPCNVVMPRTAPLLRRRHCRALWRVVTECDPSTTSREETFAKVQAATGGDFVHPTTIRDRVSKAPARVNSSNKTGRLS